VSAAAANFVATVDNKVVVKVAELVVVQEQELMAAWEEEPSASRARRLKREKTTLLLQTVPLQLQSKWQ